MIATVAAFPAHAQDVSFQGKTYYVCCSGCRDAFNEEPEKYIAEFEAKKKNKD